MKKIVTILVTVILALALVYPVLAGGDKVRGENGQGSVNQNQIVTPPWMP